MNFLIEREVYRFSLMNITFWIKKFSHLTFLQGFMKKSIEESKQHQSFQLFHLYQLVQY